jgi:hypothetical protein
MVYDTESRMSKTKAKIIGRLEREANEEGIDASTRLARIHKLYPLYGIPKEVYSVDEP